MPGAIDDWRVACEWVKECSRHGCRYTFAQMISFIVPAYNEELELSSTIAAIHAAMSGAAQAYEIIVVDDASTDATPEIAARAGGRVLSIPRRQLAAGRNSGARGAQAA